MSRRQQELHRPDFKRQLAHAIRLVWAALTVATTAAAGAPLVLPAATISRWVPVCESVRRYHRPCFLCGTTTGFIAIGHGDWHRATESNRLAIPLFAAFAANAGVGAACVARAAHRRRLRL